MSSWSSKQDSQYALFGSGGGSSRSHEGLKETWEETICLEKTVEERARPADGGLAHADWQSIPGREAAGAGQSDACGSEAQ